jgi:hypothetical protein
MKGPDLDQMIILLYRYIDLYATCIKDLVGSDLIEYNMEIDPNQQPTRQKQFCFAKSERDEIEKQVQKLKEAGIIKPSTSPWRMPIFLVEKKGSFGCKPAKRLVFEARRLNLSPKNIHTELIQ